MIEWGVEKVKEMLPIAAKARRETVDASHLTLALQCGGSDGYSGITANPALGVAADILVRNGGTAILSETPEIYGRSTSSPAAPPRAKWVKSSSSAFTGGRTIRAATMAR